MIALKNTTNNQIFYIIHKKMDGESGWDLSRLNVEYTENGQYSIVPPAGIDGYSSVNVTVDVDCKECNLTTSTVKITGDGEHTITPPSGYDGFSEVVVEVESECNDRYDEGVADQKAKLTSTTFTENGTYNREDGWNTVQVNVDTVTPYNNGERDGIDEQKAKLTSLNVTQNGTYRREDGYNEVVVAVPQLDNCEECRQAGIQEQKSKLTELQVTENGEYEREDGYNRVVVDVDLTVPYNEGKEDGAEEQKAKMTSGTFTENGTYNREDGYNQVIVNVDTVTPYNNGKEDGIEEQKAKLGTITITENGTYTAENGYKSITVNVESDCPENCPDLTVLNWTCDDVEDSYMNQDIAYSQSLLNDEQTKFTDDIDLVIAPKINCLTEGAFSGCTHLAYVPSLKSCALSETSFNYVFYNCSNLRSVATIDNCRFVSSVTGMFTGCTALTNIRGFKQLGYNFYKPNVTLDLSASTHITHTSIMNVIRSVSPSRISGVTNILKVSVETYRLLSDADIEEATDKRWCITTTT